MRPIPLVGSLPFLLLTTALPAAAQGLVLDPIVLTANRAPSAPALTGSSVSVLTGAEMETDGRPFVLQQIRDLPGVTVNQTGPAGAVSGFAIRGAPQAYVRVEVDGIEISDMTAPQVSPSLSGLMVDDASRVEVLKGSQSALYGGQAVGGVVSITSPRATGPGLQNSFLLEGGSFSTFRGAYTLTGMNDKGEFALSINRFQTDGFSSAEEADGNDEDDGYHTTRLSGSGRLHVTPQADVFAAGFWQKEDGDYDRNGGPVGDADNTFESTSWGLRGGTDFTTDAGLQNTLALSYYDRDGEQISEFGPYEPKGDRTKAEYRGAWTASEAVALQFGADYTHEASESNFDPRESSWIAGAWLQAAWTPTETFAFNASGRVDDHSEFGYFPTARATFAWLVTPQTTIRGSLANGFRAPSNYELFSSTGAQDLEPETSVSADLGVARSFAKGRGNASATVFWLEIDNLIEYDASVPPFGVYAQTDGTATSRGVELAADWTFVEAFALRGAYTYTDAEQSDGEPRNRIPKHDLSLTASGAWQRLSYDLGANFVWDYVDQTGSPSNGWADDFVVVNARLAYAVTEQAELYVRGENLLDEQYQTARGYSTSDRAFYAGVSARF